MDNHNFFLRQQQSQQRQIQQQRLLRLQHQQQGTTGISRLQSNTVDPLRFPSLHRPITPQFQQNPNPNLNLGQNVQNLHRPPIPQSQRNPNPNFNLGENLRRLQDQVQQFQSPQLQEQINTPEMQMAYQDAWRVCHPDFKRPFSSLEDACERLIPYHVVADYEEEEDDEIVNDQLCSRSQKWDQMVASNVAEFLRIFEKQVEDFNLIVNKRADGEMRKEERLMIEQLLLDNEKRSMSDLKMEMDAREKARQEDQLRMTTMAQAEQARAYSQVHSGLTTQAFAGTSALGSQGVAFSHQMRNQEQAWAYSLAQSRLATQTSAGTSALGSQNIAFSPQIRNPGHQSNPDENMSRWQNNFGRNEEGPSENILNEETNRDIGVQGQWWQVGDIDLNI